MNIIVLSSDDDEEMPPCKRIKPTQLAENNTPQVLKLNEIQHSDDSGISKEKSENNIEKPGSSQVDEEFPENLNYFFEVCAETVQDTNNDGLRDKFSIIKKFYKKCSPKIRSSKELQKAIETNTEVAKKSSTCAIIAFNDLCKYLKQASSDGDCIVVDNKENYLALKKLWKTMEELKEIIRNLENKEVNFDDEEDSTYMQLDKYKRRLKQIYKLYCKKSKLNPHSGSITHQKIVFMDSKYDEINKAISKNYKNNKIFPDYGEIEELVRKTVKQHNLSLSEHQQIQESRKCFKKLGELLQARRKKELYVSHVSIIPEQDDPASKDVELNAKLKENLVEAKKKTDEICEEFVIKQERGREDHPTSEDSESEDSNSEEMDDSDDF